jgi:outer membrane protein
MLSKISLVLNAILLILIINLYIRECNESEETEGQEQVVQVENSDTSLRIAYINTDTLDSKYLYSLEIIETLKDEMDKKQRRLERKATKSQQEFDLLQQQARTMTPSQLQQAQQRAMQLEQEIQVLQQEMATEFAEQQNDLQIKLINKLDAFLSNYNKSAGYDFIMKKHSGSELLIANENNDITNEVLQLLNNEYLGNDNKKDSL